MKKYVAVIAAIAVAGAVGVYYVGDKMDDTSASTTTSTSSYSQKIDSDSGENVAVDKTNEKTTTTTSTTTEKKNKEQTFFAEIDSVSDDILIVVPDKSSAEGKSYNKITFGLENVKTVDDKGKSVSLDDVKNFNSITVTYNGNIMETYPAQLKASKVVLSDREKCNVYFCLEGGKVIDTLTVPVGSSLESADMPNAGAYCPDGYHFEGWLLGSKTVYGIEKIEDSVSLTAKIRKD